MRIVLTRDEIKDLVSKVYGINCDFKLEIRSDHDEILSKPTLTTIVNNNNQVIDVKNLDPSPVKVVENEIESIPEESNKKKSRSNYLPQKCKNDYEKYGLIIEEFLNSAGKTTSIDLENLTLAGMEYRYRIAAKMFGYNDKISFHKDQEYNELTMSKK